jgi:hypothetical protein
MMAHYTQLPSGIDQVMPHGDVCIWRHCSVITTVGNTCLRYLQSQQPSRNCVRQTPSLPAPDSRSRHSELSNGGVLQGALAMAYVIEGLLFAFHLRGDQLDVEIHTLLVITIFLTAIVILAEIQHKSNVLLASLRPILVIMQGVWFVQAAFILFRGMSCLHQLRISVEASNTHHSAIQLQATNVHFSLVAMPHWQVLTLEMCCVQAACLAGWCVQVAHTIDHSVLAFCQCQTSVCIICKFVSQCTACSCTDSDSQATSPKQDLNKNSCCYPHKEKKDKVILHVLASDKDMPRVMPGCPC